MVKRVTRRKAETVAEKLKEAILSAECGLVSQSTQSSYADSVVKEMSDAFTERVEKAPLL